MGVSGAKEHAARLRRMRSPKVIAALDRAVFVGANTIATEMQVSITSGAVSGKNHVPSAPGEPPNADTHQLDTSIQTVRTRALHSEAQVTAPYGLALEKGTSKMAARPYARPAVRKKRAQVLDDARKMIQAVLKQGG